MNVIFVDAGNYCRSPVAEVVARKLAASAGRSSAWSFSSAGLKDKHAGQGADPRSIAVCSRFGYDLSSFRAREILAQDFARADLILAMDRENLVQLEARRPPGSQVPIRLLLDGEEVPDPYFGGDDGFETMLALIERGVRDLLRESAS